MRRVFAQCRAVIAQARGIKTQFDHVRDLIAAVQITLFALALSAGLAELIGGSHG